MRSIVRMPDAIEQSHAARDTAENGGTRAARTPRPACRIPLPAHARPINPRLGV